MYETYTRYLYELFRDSDLFQDLKTLIVNSESALLKFDSLISLCEKLLIVGVFGLGLYLVFKLLMKGWTRL